MLVSLRNSWFSNIRGDLLAGMVVALALIPEAIGFSIIAGVDPKVGLYASFCIAVVIAFDGSATTCKAVDMVAGSPLFLGSHCYLVMVGEESKQNCGQLEWARHTLEAAGFSVTTVLQQGEVETTLCSYRRAQEIDLLVMGAYGHSVTRRFLVGSSTTSVIRNAPVPVLLLR